MEKEITLKADEALNYIKNNVQTYDVLELSYNRVFVPGEVLDIESGKRLKAGNTSSCLTG